MQFSSLRCAAAVVVALAVPAVASAQRLALRWYSVGDGLVHDTVTSVLQDRKGYIWIGTYEGLSRFDGYQFVNYRLAGGTSGVIVNQVIEAPNGAIWVATNGGGIARVRDDRQAERFAFVRVGPEAGQQVNALVVGADDCFWAATDRGLFVSPSTTDPVFTPLRGEERTAADKAVRDGRSIWFQLWGGELLEVDVPTRMTRRHRFPGRVQALTVAPEGVVVVTMDGILVPVGSFGDRSWRRLDLPWRGAARAVHVDSLEQMWIGTHNSIARVRRGSVETFGARQGVSAGTVRALFRGADGTLWIGSDTAGLGVLRAESIVSFTESDGLPTSDVQWVTEGPRGVVYVQTSGGLARIDGTAAPVAQPQTPTPLARPLVGGDGALWGLAETHLLRFPGRAVEPRRASAFTLPETASFGPPTSGIAVDRQGRIWFASSTRTLWRFDPASSHSPRFERIRAFPDAVFRAALVDASGAVWGGNHGSILRLGADGSLREIRPPAPTSQPRTLYEDSKGRIWIGLRFGGLLRIDDPAAPDPRVTRYTAADGLASDTVWSIAEDRSGGIWVGTGRGLDHLDPDSGAVRHMSSADGLAGDLIRWCLYDSLDRLWVATSRGVSRLDSPEHEPDVEGLPALITRVRASSEDLAVPETGISTVPALELAASQNNVLIEYVALKPAESHHLRYQHRLLDVDGEWTAASPERSVNYARLPPGRYQFQVRALNREGRASRTPASVEFTIAPPYWQRSWFVAAVLLAAGALLMSAHRMRVRHAVAVERVRQQVAVDVHDELGSGLSQIAILSEVAKRSAPATVAPLLSESASLARSLRESMSDVVWAIDPRRDRLADVVNRMRSVLFNSLAAGGTDVRFEAPSSRELARTTLSADKRRQLLLVVKEASTNVARHAAATMVDVVFRLEGSRLRLTISDNGRGFDVSRPVEGQGLFSMRKRAESMGGQCAIRSGGSGTTIDIHIPLR